MSQNDGKGYTVDGGLIVLIGAATVEQTGFSAGQTYEFLASDPCLCRWGAGDATIADGGFDFACPAGSIIRAVCPSGDSAINVIEMTSASDGAATLAICKSRTI